MNVITRMLDAFHNVLSNSRIITAWAAKVRNQCDLIISRRFSTKDMSPELNGEHLVLNHIIPHCKVYFDVGANKGEWTNYLLNKSKTKSIQCYLYEPGNVAYSILQNRFKEENSLKIYNTALSDKIGKVDFYEQADAGELSSVVEKWGYGPISTIEVETTTIDFELSMLQIDYLDFLKIDTEGFEYKVLKGTLNAIVANKIGFVQFEYNRGWLMLGSTLSDAYQIFEENRYSVFLIKADGLYTYDLNKYGEFYNFSNFIAIAPTNMEYVKSIIKGYA